MAWATKTFNDLLQYSEIVGLYWLAIMGAVVFVVGDYADWLAPKIRARLESFLAARWRRPLEVAATVAVVFVAGFIAWQDQKSGAEKFRVERDGANRWLEIWKGRADSRWHEIYGGGGYKEQLARMPNVAPFDKSRARLGRLIAYNAPNILIEPINGATDQSGLVGVTFPTANVSNETLNIWVERLNVFIDESLVMKGKSLQKGFLPQTQIMPYQFRRVSVPISAATNKSITLEFEIDYDTVPATGLRRSYRKLVFPIIWPNGPTKPPQLDTARPQGEWER
jgi:hypothetical protein